MIVIFEPEERIQNLVVNAFAKGLRLHGEEVIIVAEDDYNITTDIKAGVVFGLSSPNYKRTIESIEERGGRTIVIDYGAIKRPLYWTIGYDGLMGNADFLNYNSPSDRWESFDIPILPWRETGKHILLTCQVPWDGSVRGTNIIEWTLNTVDFLRLVTNREIIFRPHPLAIHKTPKIPGTTWSIGPFEDDLKDAWAVVTWNSTSSGMAVLKGIPVFAMDEGSIAWSVANHVLDNIEFPDLPDREQWAYDLGYCQWTLDEIENGTVWDHLKKGLDDYD